MSRVKGARCDRSEHAGDTDRNITRSRTLHAAVLHTDNRLQQPSAVQHEERAGPFLSAGQLSCYSCCRSFMIIVICINILQNNSTSPSKIQGNMLKLVFQTFNKTRGSQEIPSLRARSKTFLPQHCRHIFKSHPPFPSCSPKSKLWNMSSFWEHVQDFDSSYLPLAMFTAQMQPWSVKSEKKLGHVGI